MRTNRPAGVLLFALLLTSPFAAADTISFDLSAPTLSGAPGNTVSFFGSVTNNSGVDLNASDFFFNFSGYDSGALTPSQDLAVTTSDFAIPSGTTSATVDLFSIQLDPSVTPGALLPLSVQLQDVNNDLSALQSVGVQVQVVPLPASGTLLLSALAAFGAMRRKRMPARY